MKNKYALSIAISVMVLFSIVTVLILYIDTQSNNQDLTTHALQYLNAQEPDITNRIPITNNDAQITFVIYSDLTSLSSKKIVDTLLSQLIDEHIATNNIQIIHKYRLELEDKTQQTDAYLYAKTMQCLLEQNDSAALSIYQDVVRANTINELKEVSNHYIINQELFTICYNQESIPELEQDMAEVYYFGISGINPRIYIGIHAQNNIVLDGVPNYTRINQSIRQQELILGN